MKITSFNKYIFFVIILFVSGSSLRVCAQIITTVANVSLKKGYGGDGGSAAFAKFNSPEGLAVDPAGNVYVADPLNNRIRKIDVFGEITTYAGNGKSGFSGDGGHAAFAELSDPTYVILDNDGNMYIADTHNNRVRKVTPGGIITTVAGNGDAGYTGDGGLAINAPLESPNRLAIDSHGNMLIGTQKAVRKVFVNDVITTICGSAQSGSSGDGGTALYATFMEITGIAVDKFDNVFIADKQAHVIRRIDNTGMINRYAGGGASASVALGDGGPAYLARLVAPADIKMDNKQNIYVTDETDSRIRKIDTAGIITTLAGNGKSAHTGDGGSAIDAGLFSPCGLGIDTGNNLYLTEVSNYASDVSNDVRYIFTGNIGNAKSAVNIYPNPTFDGAIRMYFFSTYEENVTIEIVNQAGVRVYENTVPTNKILEARLEPIGLYFMSGKSAHSKWKETISVVR